MANEASQHSKFKPENKLEQMCHDVTQKYHLSYADGAHVHLHQGAVAMYQLGYSEEQILKFGKACVDCGYYWDRGEPLAKEINDENWMEFTGKYSKEHIESLKQFFRKKAESMRWQDILKEYYPKLMVGMTGGLFHGELHIGAGIAGFGRPNVEMMMDGVAWAASEFSDFSPKHVCLLIKRELESWGKPFHYGHMLGVCSYNSYPNLDFHKYLAGIILLPRDLDEIEQTLAEVSAICYMVEGPEFFILHAVTGWKAMRSIMPHLADDETRFECTAYFLRFILATYIFTQLPAIEPTVALLKEYRDPELRAKNSLFETFDAPPAGSEDSWKEVCDLKCLNYTPFPDVDAHHPKVLHALKEDWEKYGYKPLFLEAARVVINKELFRHLEVVAAKSDDPTTERDLKDLWADRKKVTD